MLDIRKFVIFASAGSLFLSGCASFKTDQDVDYDAELVNQTAVYSWTARGNMFFSCAHDDAGFYWQFKYSEGTLFDNAGKKIGKLNPDLSITGRDNSRLQLNIFKSRHKTAPGNLKNLLYKTESAPTQGLFSRIEYVERRNAKGGLPLSKCSAVQKEELLRVPFEARYIFWR